MVKQALRRVSHILLTLVLSLTAFLGLATISDSAQAAPMTAPKASQYQVERSDEVQALQREAKAEAAEAEKIDKEPLGEKIKDRLNLDEPIPESTKKFFRQVRGEEPIERE